MEMLICKEAADKVIYCKFRKIGNPCEIIHLLFSWGRYNDSSLQIKLMKHELTACKTFIFSNLLKMLKVMC